MNLISEVAVWDEQRFLPSPCCEGCNWCAKNACLLYRATCRICRKAMCWNCVIVRIGPLLHIFKSINQLNY